MEVVFGGIGMSPEEWHEKNEADKAAEKIVEIIETWGNHNVARAVKEVDDFLNDVQQTFHMTESQRNYLKRTRLTFDKIFK